MSRAPAAQRRHAVRGKREHLQTRRGRAKPLCRRGRFLRYQYVGKHRRHCAGAVELRAGARPRAWKQISGNLFRECVSHIYATAGTPDPVSRRLIENGHICKCVGTTRVFPDTFWRPGRRWICLYASRPGRCGRGCLCAGATFGERIGEKLIQSARLLFPTRAEKRSYAEIEKQQHDSQADQKRAVIRPGRPAEAAAPHSRGKHHHRQREEDAGNLKPQNAPDALEGPQKPSHAASQAAGRLAGNVDGGPYRLTRLLCPAGGRRLAQLALLARSVGGGALPGHAFSCHSFSGHTFSGHTSGDAESDAQGAANGLRLHSQFDGNSARGGHAFHRPAARPVARNRRWK